MRSARKAPPKEIEATKNQKPEEQSMKIEIKSWYSGKIIFAHDCEGNSIKLTLEAGIKAKVCFDYARLVGASLVGASLVGARLDGASLVGASLVGARLDYARLVGASLVGARLVGASLVGASLENGEKILDSERPVFQIGGLGSAARYFVAYLTDMGIRVRTGCFFGSISEFKAKLKVEHKDNVHAQEYMAALTLVETHFVLWPAKTKKK
jgi:hypothetical protein